MIRILLMMNQAAEFIWSMWITGHGCSKLPSCPLQLKPLKMHSPTCCYLDAAQVSSKLEKTPNPQSKECHGWGLFSHHLPFFMNIIPVEFCSQQRLKAVSSLEPSFRGCSQVTAKISGVEELLGQLWAWQMYPVPLLDGCIARRTLNRLRYTIPLMVWRADLSELLDKLKHKE